jgi:ABC-2 type transport system permease protein
MNGFKAVFKRELKSYFTTPIAYVFLVVFLFFSGYLTFKNGFFEIRQADMTAFFYNMPLLFVFLVPAVAMRLWAEERKTGSIELLMTLPITVMQAVLGKFFAAWVFLAIALLLTFPMVITVFFLGAPDTGLIVMGYIGSLLMTVVACAVLVFAGLPTSMNYLSTFLPAGLVSTFEAASFQTHFDSIQRGVLQFTDISYFVILIVGWVAANAIILEERMAR